MKRKDLDVPAIRLAEIEKLLQLIVDFLKTHGDEARMPMEQKLSIKAHIEDLISKDSMKVLGIQRSEANNSLQQNEIDNDVSGLTDLPIQSYDEYLWLLKRPLLIVTPTQQLWDGY